MRQQPVDQDRQTGKTYRHPNSNSPPLRIAFRPAKQQGAHRKSRSDPHVIRHRLCTEFSTAAGEKLQFFRHRRHASPHAQPKRETLSGLLNRPRLAQVEPDLTSSKRSLIGSPVV